MQGINVMHVAAQGDQPYSIAYFMGLGLEINSRDKRKSTPLHWAAVSGAELTLTYVIAFGGDLEAMDVKGHTALHFACKKHKENKSTKGIKQLLLKGANRNAMDYEGKRPIDYVQNESKPSGQTVEIIKILRDDGWSFTGDCLVLKTSFRKQEKKPFTLIAYFVLMILAYAMQHASTYKALELTGTDQGLLLASKCLFWISMALWLVVWQKDPGFLRKEKSLNFTELLENFEASSLCPDCQVIRTPRCRHCTICKTCVDRFDHHCPWVNNCIGRGNFAYFYTFVFT